MPQSPSAGTARTQSGPPLWLSLVVLGLGVVLAAVGAALGITAIVRDATSPSYAMPAHFQRHFGTGNYDVFVAEPNLLSAIGINVVITGPSGEQVPVVPQASAETLDRGGMTYDDDLRFHIDTAGTYSVTISSPGLANSRVIVTRPLQDAARRAAGWFAMLGLGFLVGVLGIVLLIVGVSRRRRANRPPPGQYFGPPPGWYPDQTQPGTSRWWDGRQWTPHTHPSG